MELIPYEGGSQITPVTGALFMEKYGDTLYRVKKYRIHFIDKSTKEITHDQYVRLSRVLQSNNIPRFVQFTDDGEVIATAQIAGVKPYETVVDTRREEL